MGKSRHNRRNGNRYRVDDFEDFELSDKVIRSKRYQRATERKNTEAPAKKNEAATDGDPVADADDADDLVVDEGEQFVWLTEQIENQAINSSTRQKAVYGSSHVCVMGLERILQSVNDDSFERLPACVVEVKITLMNSYFKKYMEIQAQSTGKYTASEMIQMAKDAEGVNTMYTQLSAVLTDRLAHLKREEGMSMLNSTQNQQQHVETHSAVRVKKIDIEPFAGDIKKWPQFKSLFEDCIHNRPVTEISNSSKFYQLISHLTPDSEARKTIAGLEQTGANYDAAWSLLCDTYDNERRIVNDHVTSFIDMGPVRVPSRESLLELVNNTNIMIQGVKKHHKAVDGWDPILVPILVRKLDGESAAQWALKRDKKKVAELAPLLEFIRDRAEALDADGAAELHRPSHSQGNGSHNNNNIVSKNGHFRGPIANRLGQQHSTDSSGNFKSDPRTISKQRSKCYHCQNSHQIFDCADFGRLPAETQVERLDTLGVCVKCLRRGHNKSSCRARNCGCGGEHNEKLLCPRKRSKNLLTVTQSQPMDVAASLIATLRVYACDSNGNSFRVRAMSDGGSHVNMISSSLMQRLKLKPNKLSIPLHGAGQFDIKSKSIVDLMIKPADNGLSDGEWIRAGVLSTISNKLPLNKFDIADWNHIQGIPLADTTFNMPDDIDILLSVEFMARISLEGIRKDVINVDRPIACNTAFGWVVYGALPAENGCDSMQVLHLSIAENDRIAENLERLWRVDEPMVKVEYTKEEELCTQIFNDTTTRSSDGRYIVRMPIVENPPKFGNSLRAAMARQFSNERRFKKDPVLKQNYIKDIQQFIDMDHIELVPPNEINKNESDVYYIPHHAANSSKFRVVFDGSVKTTSGVALNDILLNGPRLQDDLVVILMRFRAFRVALTTDVTKMYRQVMVPEDQRDLLRIVWREHESEPLRHYRMKRQTYGLKSSAYCCVAALRKCALDYSDQFPLASRAVLRSFYVDDGTLGADNEAEAEELYRQLNLMLAKGGFPLAKWATNNVHMQSIIGTTASSVDLDLFNESSVLGIKWSVADDRFKYGLRSEIPNQPITKRFVVATVARLFDPVGWIAPIVVFGKILIQEAWRSNCDWDDVLPQDIQGKWHIFQDSLKNLNKISIPRWLGISGSVKIHGFADASQKSYGICFYTRAENDDDITCNLIIAKTKVAPLTGMTIPRLELSAAHMMANSCLRVCQTYGVGIEDVTLWSDSSIVVHWLSKEPSALKQYVSSRVKDIKEWSNGAEWKHVRTHDNPADLASRGVIVDELIDNSLWFHGPSWLSQKQDKWPISRFEVNKIVQKAAEKEMLPAHIMTIVRGEILPRINSFQHSSGNETLIDCCGSMMKLVRVTARVLRFIDAVTVKRQRKRYESIAIGKDEYLNAQLVWIKYHQQKYFSSEIAELNAARDGGKLPGSLSRESSLLKMTPFIDGNGVLRVGGRIKRSLMPFDTKHPVIIHGDGKFAFLLAREAHASTLHGGTQQCMQYIRQRFWVTGVRKIVKKIACKCIPCFRQRREVASQLMGDLPRSRVVGGHAFESVGVDYFGPITVKERTGRCKKTFKAYVAIFVCMKTKGVYIDMVTDLTTDAFMACLSRLISLRGKIHEIFSDNATTFHGASNEIRAIHTHWVELSKSVKLDPIKWTFITPLSPSQGGLWERAVRSAKHHLRRVIGAQTLTYEEFHTLLSNVSACLNSRPLIALDDDPTTAQALTPAHLIMGRALIGPLQYDYTEVPDNRLLRWQLVQKTFQQFWTQWQEEYVVTQIERGKWRTAHENVKEGSVVLLKIDNMPPTHWPLGLVTETFPGEDGRVRNVEVKVGAASYRRCVSKIAVLPISDEDETRSEASADGNQNQNQI